MFLPVCSGSLQHCTMCVVWNTSEWSPFCEASSKNPCFFISEKFNVLYYKNVFLSVQYWGIVISTINISGAEQDRCNIIRQCALCVGNSDAKMLHYWTEQVINVKQYNVSDCHKGQTHFTLTHPLQGVKTLDKLWVSKCYHIFFECQRYVAIRKSI